MYRRTATCLYIHLHQELLRSREFVGSLVRYANCDFSKTTNCRPTKFSPLTFERSRSEFKVKTTVLKIFKYCLINFHQIRQSGRHSATRSNHFDKIQYGGTPGRSLHCVGAVSSIYYSADE